MNAQLLIGSLIGGAIATAAFLVLDQPAPREEAVAALPAHDRVIARLDSLDRRLAELTSRLDVGLTAVPDTPTAPGLRGSVPAASSGSETPTADAPAPAAISVDDLAKALVKAEDQKWAERKNSELLAAANRRLKNQDPQGAREILDRLLRRDLDEKERVSALVQLGVTTRAAGDGEASIEALEEAVRLSGRDDETGQYASYQLVWSYTQTKDYAAAAIEVDRLLNSKSLSPTFEPNVRWASVIIAQARGDSAAADRGYDDFVQRYADTPQGKKLIEDLDRRRAAQK